MNPIKISQEHLKENKQTYYQHGHFSFVWGLSIILTGIISVIHAFIPGIFQHTVPNRILKIAKIIEQRHPEIFKEYFPRDLD